MLKPLILRFVVALILVVSFLPIFEPGRAAGDDGRIIADHTVVDLYDDIPQEYIDKVKTMYLNVPGESHAVGYRVGLELLEQLDDRFQVINNGNEQPPPPTDNQSLRVNGWVYLGNGGAGEAQWYTWHAYDDPSDAPGNNENVIKNHLDYCDNGTNPGIEISAIGFGWCWDMSYSGTDDTKPGGSSDNIDGIAFRWAGASVGGPDNPDNELGRLYGLRWGLDDDDYALTSNHVNMDDYLEATEEYINYIAEHNYNTKVFFTTGPVDGDAGREEGYQREIKQQYIRDYVITHDKILFDYADILTYSDDDPENQYLSEWEGHNFPQIHPDNLNDYDEEWNIIGQNPATLNTYHIGEVGALRLGKAMWWLLARLAGWDGNTSQHTSVTITDNGNPGLSFGNHSAGAVKQGEAASPSITIKNETTGNVTIYLMGTDFTGAGGSFSINNAFYFDSDNSTAALPMSASYSDIAWKTLAPGETLSIYHWLTIPDGTPAGSYSSDFTYKAQEIP